jgi:hypothetical protein
VKIVRGEVYEQSKARLQEAAEAGE